MKRWAPTVVLAVGVLDFALEQSIVIPALPLLAEEHSASPTSITWVLTGFLVALAVSTPLAGRLGDTYGRKRVLLASLGLFAVGSVMSAAAESIGLVIAGRVVQGLGAGVGPLAVALARDHAGPARAPRAIGLIIGFSGLGLVIGLLAAGRLVEWFSVAAIFWTLAVVAVMLIVAVAIVVPESRSHQRQPTDWLGAILLAGGVGGLMLGISKGNDWGWGSAEELAMLTGSVAMLAAFVAVEQRTDAPLVDLATLRAPAIRSVNAVTFVVSFALFIAYALVPLIAGLPEETGYGLGLSTTEIGWLLMPGAVANLVGGPLGGWTVGRVGARTQVITGTLLAGAGYVAFVAFADTVTVIAIAMIPIGFAVGYAFCALVSLLVVAAPEREIGTTLGVNGVLRAIGAALGAQVAASILSGADELAPGIPVAGAFTDAFALAGVSILVAAAAAALVPRRDSDALLAVTAAR